MPNFISLQRDQPPGRAGRSPPRGRLWSSLRCWSQTHGSVPPWFPAPARRPGIGSLVAVLITVLAVSLDSGLLPGAPNFGLARLATLLTVVLLALIWGAGPSLTAMLLGTALLAWLIGARFSTRAGGPQGLLDESIVLVGGLLIIACISWRVDGRRNEEQSPGVGKWAQPQAQDLTASLAEVHARAALECNRLEAISASMADAVTFYDREGRIQHLNTTALAFYGLEDVSTARSIPASERGMRLRLRDAAGEPLPPERWPVARLLNGEKIASADAEDILVTNLRGREMVASVSGMPVQEVDGRIVGAVTVMRDVTERRRLEREVAARARELEAIFEALTDGLVVLDAQGCIERSNTAARQILGFEAHPEFLTLSFQERATRYASRDTKGQPIPPGDLATARLLRGEVFTSSQAAEQRLETPDGREVFFSITGRPLRNAEGMIIGAVGIMRDETERQRLEREVAERAAQLEAIFESIADGVVVTDRQGRILHMNQAHRTLLGLEQDPTGRTLSQLDGLADFASYTPTGQRLTEGEDPLARVFQGAVLTNEQSVDTILRTRAGREILLNTTGAPIRDATGHVLGSVVVARDVTEQRHLERQTRAALDALLAMAEALVQTPDRASAPGTAAGPGLYPAVRRLAELTRSVLGCQQVSIVTVEPATAAMMPLTLVGLAPENEQQWWTDLEAHPRMDQRLHPDVVAALQAGEPVLLDKRHLPLPIWQQLTPQRASLLVPMRIGETLVGLLRVDCDAQGEAYAGAHRQALIRAVARLGALVLERERLLRDREEARARELALRETQAQMDTFLGMAGHELKTPLTSIKLALHLAERRIRRLLQHEREGANDLAPVLEQVTRTEHQADRLDRLVNDLLDVSRVQAGKLDLQLEPADLASIVREAVEEQRQANPERTLLLHVPADLAVPVTVDADRIGQVVTNYLTNALKYSPAARPVTVGLGVEEGQARVWVRDEGPGLPPEEQERIWDRFHRVKGIEVQSGTGVGLGLGLHICRTIIERHQGQVGVASAPGRGSTFWFSLPLGGEPEEQGSAPG